MKIEIELITACINKEQRAEYELYEKTYSYLMSICLRYVNSREEAREMFNIGFFKILTNLDKYQLDKSFKSWMARIMVNVLIDEYRKEKKHHQNIQYVEDYTENEEHADINYALVKMDVEQINALIVKLPPVSQKVFNMYVIDGFSHKEIAESLGMTDGTSRWHLNFSKKQLKEMIQKITSPVKMVS
ncbi:MAG TPA: sigma-70 family RNA polymerase sigma factor [Nitrosopumilaceae archaeon]|jgi:RNA polymerase sigma factor (sigma-70 family)|nr:sigma-70 family RNA polymerase sigma factor [Nitrosopumilaceae archaeon]